ncbi:hypothetical protein BDV27DRAFT_122272 [Aspergillus caelatus]|uniref:Uncharacterized protein n=1 Tax=Aspergillus caelatus TaxID=61420 RepID=A0A5N7AIT9_9EURO|nr:uncharacterized protein BDV27DRAFT_122272 [Aspergillus caelatus]KAE8368580.1 hypothetical protein BDV27DRAFT_122272 [Aspergillus caelatus]
MHCWELIDHRILIPYTRAAFSILTEPVVQHCDYFLLISLIFLLCVYARQSGYGMSDFPNPLLGMAIWKFP